MNQTVVDVGVLAVSLGDESILFGPGDDGEPTIAHWANWSATIAHAMVIGIDPCVLRACKP